MKIDKKFAGHVVEKLWRENVYKSFNEARHFKPYEFNDEPSGKHVDLELVWRLDLLRDVVDAEVRIHWRAGGGFDPKGHKEGSWHARDGICRAADWHAEGLTLEEMFRLSCLCGFRGIGAYPWWINPGCHTDVRPIRSSDKLAYWFSPRRGVYEGLPPHYHTLII